MVIASDDPSEKASGTGPAILREAGVEVEFVDGAEAEAAELLNQPFRKHARTGRPLVVMKSAITLDGRVATAGGDSQWISSEESRLLAHRWRAEADAVCVGHRHGAGRRSAPHRQGGSGRLRQPTRVVFDSEARLPLTRAWSRRSCRRRSWSSRRRRRPRSASRRSGMRAPRPWSLVAGPADRVKAGLRELGSRDITSLLLEGGPTLAGAFRDADEIDELRLFIAPIVVGGMLARPLIAGNGAMTLPDATRGDLRWTGSAPATTC